MKDENVKIVNNNIFKSVAIGASIVALLGLISTVYFFKMYSDSKTELSKRSESKNSNSANVTVIPTATVARLEHSPTPTPSVVTSQKLKVVNLSAEGLPACLLKNLDSGYLQVNQGGLASNGVDMQNEEIFAITDDTCKTDIKPWLDTQMAQKFTITEGSYKYTEGQDLMLFVSGHSDKGLGYILQVNVGSNPTAKVIREYKTQNFGLEYFWGGTESTLIYDLDVPVMGCEDETSCNAFAETVAEYCSYNESGIYSYNVITEVEKKIGEGYCKK